MAGFWFGRSTAFLSAILLIAALFYLQIADAPKELIHCLRPYGLIAVAVLLTVTARPDFAVNRACLGATLAFFAYVVARALLSPAPYHARADLYSVLASLCVYGLAIRVFTSGRSRINLFAALLCLALVHVVVSVVQAGFGENYSLLISSLEEVEPSQRGSGLFVNPDHLAGLLEVLGIFGLSIGCWSRLPHWGKVCLGYLTALCYLGVILTGSRGAYLSVAASVLVFAFLSLRALRAAGTGDLLKFGGIGFLVFLAAAGTTWFLIQQNAPLRHRFERLLVDEGRVDMWQAAIAQWRLQPAVGTGSGTYRFYGREFRSERLQADPVDVHNDYLHLLAEYGAIGAIGFLLFFAAHAAHGWRTYLRFGPQRLAAGTLLSSDRLALTIGALGALTAYVVHSAVDYNLHIPSNALLLAFVFGILASSAPEKGEHRQRGPVRLLPAVAHGLVAIVLLVQCLRLYPGTELAEKARVALRDDDPARAISLANAAPEHEQQNPRIYFTLGRALIAIANNPGPADERTALYERALQAFDRARQLVPLDGSYPLEMAFAFDRLGRFEEAEPMYQLARARDPRSTNVEQAYQAHLQRWSAARSPN